MLSVVSAVLDVATDIHVVTVMQILGNLLGCIEVCQSLVIIDDLTKLIRLLGNTDLNANHIIAFRRNISQTILPINFLLILLDALVLIGTAEEINLITRHTSQINIESVFVRGLNAKAQDTAHSTTLSLLLIIKVTTLGAGDLTSHLKRTTGLRKIKNSICHIKSPLCNFVSFIITYVSFCCIESTHALFILCIILRLAY